MTEETKTPPGGGAVRYEIEVGKGGAEGQIGERLGAFMEWQGSQAALQASKIEMRTVAGGRGGLGSPRDAWVSELQVNDETVNTLVSSIASELHDLAALGNVPSLSVEHQLQLVFDELRREAAKLIRVTPVATDSATDLLSIRTSFCPLAYRRAADAAKDRMRLTVKGD